MDTHSTAWHLQGFSLFEETLLDQLHGKTRATPQKMRGNSPVAWHRIASHGMMIVMIVKHKKNRPKAVSVVG